MSDTIHVQWVIEADEKVERGKPEMRHVDGDIHSARFRCHPDDVDMVTAKIKATMKKFGATNIQTGKMN